MKKLNVFEKLEKRGDNSYKLMTSFENMFSDQYWLENCDSFIEFAIEFYLLGKYIFDSSYVKRDEEIDNLLSLSIDIYENSKNKYLINNIIKFVKEFSDSDFLNIVEYLEFVYFISIWNKGVVNKRELELSEKIWYLNLYKYSKTFDFYYQIQAKYFLCLLSEGQYEKIINLFKTEHDFKIDKSKISAEKAVVIQTYLLALVAVGEKNEKLEDNIKFYNKYMKFCYLKWEENEVKKYRIDIISVFLAQLLYDKIINNVKNKQRLPYKKFSNEYFKKLKL